MALALSPKPFSVSTPSVWNSLSYNCRSAQLLSTFKHILSCLILTIVNVNTQPSLCHYAPLIRFRHGVVHDIWCYTNVFWLIDWVSLNFKVLPVALWKCDSQTACHNPTTVKATHSTTQKTDLKNQFDTLPRTSHHLNCTNTHTWKNVNKMLNDLYINIKFLKNGIRNYCKTSLP